jgi:tRNA-guanine family transglycosylase
MSKYFGVIGNRDHIKISGEKLPFWQFLDEQPEGWLCSIFYRRNDVPSDRQRIWDCGAWSYKDQDIPKLGSMVVTPESILDLYRQYANPGDFIIAPDHMLIPGMGDLNARREFNRDSAIKFNEIAFETEFRPMATVHGESIDERVTRARELIDVGYDALALGGLAGQASKKRMILDVVTTMRREFPNAWLHVLGLSSPSYATVWSQIGIDSFDGASHFRQAFNGRFFMSEGAKLVGFQAVKNDEEVIAPLCDCKACSALRLEGIDTRRFGSNESNMGRAAHNLNHLMRSLKCAMQVTTPLQTTLIQAHQSI